MTITSPASCVADPLTGHFTQADSIIPEPGKAYAFDRYAYVLNNPIRYSDPSGHRDSGECGPGEDCDESDEERAKAERNALLNLLKNNEKNGCKYGNCERGLEVAVFTTISLASVSAITTAVSDMASMIPVVKTAAEAGSAAETVNIACGGDCSDEAQEAKNFFTQAIPQSSTSIARELGKIGESLSGIDKNTKHIMSITNTAKYRIPDQLNTDFRLLSEVKNVSYLPLTNQIKDFILYSNLNRYNFELWVRETTNLSTNLVPYIESGNILLRTIPNK